MSDGDDGLTSEQFHWLVLAAVGIGALVLIAIVGVTALSAIYGGGADTAGPPAAAFDVQTIDRSDGVAANVTHAGGEAVNPTSLVVEVNGEPRGTWTELGGEGADIVAPDYRLLVGNLTAGDTVAVVWVGEGDDRMELGRGTMAAS